MGKRVVGLVIGVTLVIITAVVLIILGNAGEDTDSEPAPTATAVATPMATETAAPSATATPSPTPEPTPTATPDPAMPPDSGSGLADNGCDTSKPPWSSSVYRFSALKARARDDLMDGVADGVMRGYYTGRTVSVDAKDVDMDHLVARNYACQNGGFAWGDDKVRTFVKDLDNLVATWDEENRRKSDKGPSEYLPELWRCEFAERFDLITSRYEIDVPEDDRTVIAGVIQEECPIPDAPVTGTGGL